MALSVTVHGITIKTGTQTSGRLGTADITTQDGLDTVVYTLSTAPDMDYAIAAVSVCNREQAAAEQVYLAVCDSDIPKDQDFIEWNTTLVPNGVLERTQLTLTPGQRVVLRWGNSEPELVPDSEIVDLAGSWTTAVTGTATVDSTVNSTVTFTAAETDTWTLTSSSYGSDLELGETYRLAVSFYSTDTVGENASVVVDTVTDGTAHITLGVEDMNRVDDYRTYSVDLVAGTDIPISADSFRISATDVSATVDRITFKKIS